MPSSSHPAPAPEPPRSAEQLLALLHSRVPEELVAAAASRLLTEDLALAFLNRRDLPGRALEEISKNASVMKHRKVIVAVVGHPRTPRHVAMPIARHLYTFELMQIALGPAIPADIKVAAEEAIVARLETISSGERLSMARQGSTRIAAELLHDPEERIFMAAMMNPRLTEVWIGKALRKKDVRPEFVRAVCKHEKWSLRRDLRLDLLRNPHTPFAFAISFAQSLPTQQLREVLRQSELPENVRSYLAGEVERRAHRS